MAQVHPEQDLSGPDPAEVATWARSWAHVGLRRAIKLVRGQRLVHGLLAKRGFLHETPIIVRCPLRRRIPHVTDDHFIVWDGSCAQELCNAGSVTIGETIISEETGEVEEAHNVIPCRRCRPTDPPLLSAEEMAECMGSVRWVYAWSYHDIPHLRHEYTLKKEQDPERFERAVATIWNDGWNRGYIGRVWRSLDIGPDHYVWLNKKPSESVEPPDAILINRAGRTQDRLV